MSKQEEIDFIRACFEQAKVLNYNYAREMLEDIFPIFTENTKNDFFTTPYADSKTAQEHFDYKIKLLTTNLDDAKRYAADWERRAIVLEQKMKHIHQSSGEVK